ncbi:MAG: biopolymer transporter ExbD [Planctomycetaceae bacterium]
MRIKRGSSNVFEADMTPMIDMVFQLVAFFMIVTNFDQQQADERVKLPMDQLATPRQEARKLEITVNIGFNRDATGKILSDPLVLLPGGDVDVLTYGKVNLGREAAVARARGGKEEIENTSIAIRADSEVPTGLVQEVIKLSQEHGFSKFSLKAMAGDGE